MSAANNILPFAQGGGANVQTQAAFLADSQRTIGNQPGVARADFVNKAMLQASAIAVGLAQFMADNQATDVSDSLTGSQLSAMMKAAIKALGRNFGGATLLSGATALTAANAGQFFRTNGTGYTITLPASATLNVGDSFLIQASGTGPVTAACQGADVMDVGVSTPASVVLQNGDDCMFTFAGSGVFAVTGMGNSKNSASFAAQLGSPGYIRHPSGLYVQFGVISVGAGVSTGSATLPQAFPSAPLFGFPSSPNISTIVTTTGVTTTAINIACSTNGAFSVPYLALGY